jgi:hypothetical protein
MIHGESLFNLFAADEYDKFSESFPITGKFKLVIIVVDQLS